MPEPSRVVIEQDPEDPLINRFRVVLEEVVREQHSEEPPAPSVATPPVPPKRIREARLGPIDIRIDMAPFMKVLDVLHTVYNNLVSSLTGPELMTLIEELVEGSAKPPTSTRYSEGDSRGDPL